MLSAPSSLLAQLKKNFSQVLLCAILYDLPHDVYEKKMQLVVRMARNIGPNGVRSRIRKQAKNEQRKPLQKIIAITPSFATIIRRSTYHLNKIPMSVLVHGAVLPEMEKPCTTVFLLSLNQRAANR
jgi:hypothetical protein